MSVSTNSIDEDSFFNLAEEAKGSGGRAPRIQLSKKCCPYPVKYRNRKKTVLFVSEETNGEFYKPKEFRNVIVNNSFANHYPISLWKIGTIVRSYGCSFDHYGTLINFDPVQQKYFVEFEDHHGNRFPPMKLNQVHFAKMRKYALQSTTVKRKFRV